MNNLFKIFYVFFSSIYRDCFGKNGWDLPILKYRFVEHIIAFAMTFLLCYFDKGIKWWWCLWIALWVQIEFALSHGCCYDLATHGYPDEAMIKRYEKMVGYKLVCKLFPQDEWYGFGFDFILLTIRYTYPLLPMCFLFNPCLLCLGLLISGLYAIYRYCPYCQNHRWLDVEIYSGFCAGLFISFL